jgi:hypothetical protein
LSMAALSVTVMIIVIPYPPSGSPERQKMPGRARHTG